MNYIFKSIIIIFLFLGLVLTSTNVGSQTLPKPVLTLVMVHSYTYNNPCTAPQEEGMLSRINELTSNYDVRIRSFYLDAKLTNLTKDQKEIAAKRIIDKIKALHPRPDFLFFTDDAAFEFVGIPMVTRGYTNSNGTQTPAKILVSGINKPLSDYVSSGLPEKARDNIIAVEEKISLKKLWPILTKAQVIASKWYIIWDDTETSFYMVHNYNDELVRQGIKEEKISRTKILTVKHLKDFIEKTQAEDQGVYILAFQSLLDEKTNKHITKENLAWVFTGRNTKHLELAGNSIFVQYGFAMSVGPDFEGMGKTISNHFVDVVMKRGFKGCTLEAKEDVAINIKRLRELGLQSITDSNFNSIKRTYQGY